MTNIQSKSLIPFCKFIDKSVIHVSIFYMHCVRQLLIHFLYIDGLDIIPNITTITPITNHMTYDLIANKDRPLPPLRLPAY